MAGLANRPGFPPGAFSDPTHFLRVSAVQIKISSRHGHLSEATQAKLQAKLEKLTRLFERLTEVELTVDLADPAKTEVELRVDSEHKHDFVAKDTADDFMTAVDGVIHKLEQQLRKYKEKVQEHRGPGLRQQSAEATGTAADAAGDQAE
ncbi:MAG: ribosome-associated translation inhibitor RaiA [Planctomycetes bacterium]|nr:ribosome-associated translation inhibitor RaiA [Planctomycetota bacterium]